MKTLNSKSAYKIYECYDKRIQDYMSLVIASLQEEYKVVPESYRISLDLLAEQLNIYFKALDAINKEGMQPLDSGRRTAKHNMIPVMQTAESKIVQLLTNFALQPFSRAKMRKLQQTTNVDDDDFDLEDLLK